MKLFRFLVGWWGSVVGVIPPTPADRTFIVDAESRAFIVELDSRIFAIDAESRVFVV